jgi:hypothetical protein
MRSKYEVERVADYFEGTFAPGSKYDGCYHTETARPDEEAREAFSRLTFGRIIWTQVHGDVKNAVTGAMFQPYPNWPELYECARDIVAQHRRLGTSFHGDITCAKLMGETMALLRARYQKNAPKWWLPIMKKLRGTEALTGTRSQ